MKKLILYFGLLLLSIHSFCQIRLPRLISDNAVLQRDRAISLFGWSSAGEKITVSFDGKSHQSIANDSGEWKISIPPQKAGGPHDLVFDGNSKLIVKNVLFGDVWLCSGQSNMEMMMRNVADKYPEVVSSSENPFIRHFAVPQRYNFKNANTDLSGGEWKEADPQNVLTFSAVAYFFARQIYEKHKIPIGLINASLGGSPAEAWLSEDALKEFPNHLEEATQFKSDSLIKAIESADTKRISAWYTELGSKDSGITNGWKARYIEDSDWHEMDVPGYWKDYNKIDGNGVVWFRRSFSAPSSMTGKSARLLFGRVVDQDSVFINGKFVGTTSYQYPQRRYSIEEGLLQEGENTIAVKVINQSGRGGFVLDKPYLIASGNDTIDLKGPWKYNLGTNMPPLASQTFIRWKPLGLYNSMIAPLTLYPITGVIWYQGESNTGRADEYKRLLPALISNWRGKWNYDFPFIYVQLPNFMESKVEPGESQWAELREAQYQTLKVPKTAMAVTIDLGEWNDIHPLDKQTVGQRLALHAQKMIYGEKNLAVMGPEVDKFEFNEKQVVIKFKVHGELNVHGDSLHHVAISADGKSFVWANTEVTGNTVKVWHPAITNAVAVRYAWADNPSPVNLYDKSGLPAPPFEIRRPD